MTNRHPTVDQVLARSLRRARFKDDLRMCVAIGVFVGSAAVSGLAIIGFVRLVIAGLIAFDQFIGAVTGAL
jgi:hypothetical protein